MYLDELRGRLHEVLDVYVSVPTLCRSLKLLGFTRKVLEKRARERSEVKRAVFRTEVIARC